MTSILKIFFRKLRNPLLGDLCYFSVSFLFKLTCSVVRCNFNLCCEFVKFNWTVKKTSNKYFYLLLSRRKQLEFHSNCIYQITSGMQWWLGRKCSNFSSMWKFLLDLFSCNLRHKFVSFCNMLIIFCQNEKYACLLFVKMGSTLLYCVFVKIGITFANYLLKWAFGLLAVC